MKKTDKMKIIVISAAAVLAAVTIGIGCYLWQKWESPEAALIRTIADVHEDGMAGLEAHMTEKTWKRVKTVTDLADNAIISGILSFLSRDNETSWLKREMANIDWSIEDVLEGKESAEVMIGFKYEDSVSGSIALEMIRDGRDWKISGVSWPTFKKFFN